MATRRVSLSWLALLTSCVTGHVEAVAVEPWTTGEVSEERLREAFTGALPGSKSLIEGAIHFPVNPEPRSALVKPRSR